MDRAIELLIPRRATRKRSAPEPSETRPLAEWRDLDAYVLLAEPGAGKSEAFKQEVAADETGSRYFTAQDFVTLVPRPDWFHKTLFIDGLDEMRAGSGSHDALDDIRRRLDELGRPRFRLSCREADWFGAVDVQRLHAVAPQGEIEVLQLEPLELEDIKALLRQWPSQVPDVDRFMHEAEQQQLMPLLGNPLLLELIVEAVRGGKLPDGRSETYKLACEKLGFERNPSHRLARRAKPVNVNSLLDDAGLLCAVLLLAGSEGFTDSANGGAGREIPIDVLPAELSVQDAGAVFASRVFTTDGGIRLPRHRTIAEYLAARAIAKRIALDELPISRVLALMSVDGGIVEPLRGLNAWLAVHCLSERRLLIDLDPLGVVSYGDVRSFLAREKRQVLDGLHREAQRFQWFRNGNWESHPFGALGTQDMVSTFEKLLAKPDRTPAHQSLLECVLDAIKHGDDMPELAGDLEAVVRDPSFRDGIRQLAIGAWLRQATNERSKAVGWLREIRAGRIEDRINNLAGQLLRGLYPDHIGPVEALEFLHPSKVPGLSGDRLFWIADFLERTPASSLPSVADGLLARFKTWDSIRSAHELHHFIGELLFRVLESAGETEPVDRVYRWLGVGLDEHDSVFLGEAGSRKVRDWLTRHPQTQKDLFSYAISKMPADAPAAAMNLYRAEQRLYGADRPRDWCRWLLEQAAKTDIEMVARDCLVQAALAAINSSPRYDISIEEVERWLGQHRRRWPIGDDDEALDPWLKDVWWLPLSHWQGVERRRTLDQEGESRAAQASRRAELVANLADINNGTAAPGLMHQIALAYQNRFTDISGETPEARVQDFLVGSAEEAGAAIDGVKRTLQRADLPSVDDILHLDLEQRYHWIRPVCLLAAELNQRDDPTAALQWSDPLARQMVAFRLTDGTGNAPAWYAQLAEQRPQIVAEVMEPYVRSRIRKHADHHITGLFELAREDAYRQVSRLVLPGLLRGFPHRANDAQRFVLNRSLLPAASRHLERTAFREIVDSRLALKSLDAGQRIAWFVASLQFDADRRSRELVDFIGRSQSRATDLGHALENQSDRGGEWSQLPVEVLARLIEMLGPHAAPEFRPGVGTVTDADRRRDLVRPFIQQLAGSPDSLAGEELKRLRALPVLKHWSIAFDAAQHEHVRVARTARFAHATAEEVAHTLANQSPANALDLAALVIDQLRMIERKLRGDETDDLYLFRCDDKATPKLENECRNVLLGKLREPLLKHQVQLEKEASAAHDKRADLRPTATVRGQRVVVPVEVKKDDYKGDREKRWSLWTAWREQLDKLYVIDPAAQRVGIYLVLWFGVKPLRTPEPRVLPSDAKDLQRLLIERIPIEDRSRLQVVVLDLSLPQH
jgi:hypothetical protein